MGLEEKKKEMEEMEGLSAEKEEMPASTNVDNLIEISLKWKVQMKLSYDAGFHKCTYADFLQDHTDIIFLKYNHSAELVNTQLDSSKQTPIREGAGVWGGQKLSFYSSHCAKLICCMQARTRMMLPSFPIEITMWQILNINRIRR